MRNKLFAVLVIGTLVMGVAGVSAQGPGILGLPTGNNWWEASLVQNAGTAVAQVTFDPIPSIDTPGAIGQSIGVSIPVGANINFMPGQWGNIVLDDGFNGSAVVSSDQPIVAIGSVANNPIGDIGVTGGRAGAQYPGISQDAVANKISFPVVKNDYKGKSTTFYIQTVTPGTIDVTYIMNNGASSYTDSKTTTQAGQRATFSPSDVTAMPIGCTDATCLGAAVFNSTVQIAGVYVEYTTTDVNPPQAQVLLATRGFTDNDSGTTIVMPAVKSLWKGRTTGIQIQNVGTAEATVDFTLAYQNGSASAANGKVVQFTIPAGASATYFPGNHTASDTLLGPFGGGSADEFVGAATITSNQPIVAICNENDFLAPTVTKQTVYAGFASANASNKILFPLVKEWYKDNTTGLQIMNVGSADVTITADYVFKNNTFTVNADGQGNPITIAPGGAFTFWGVTSQFWGNANYTAYTNDFGGVTINAPAGAQIVGIAQEAVYPGATGANNKLDTKNYEGFNQ